MSKQANRLETGGRIDRSRPLSFHFDGKAYKGFAGDTLASALLANDISIVGRSFKLRRPRGIVGSGAEEPNAILQVGRRGNTEPNLRATQVPLVDGLHAKSTRGWPTVGFDVGAINDYLSPVLGAGFYYKTFMWPRTLWPRYENFIRRSAGFGKAPTRPDPDRYEHLNAHCDVLVAGGGPTGLMAALAAARCGARVIIADEQVEFGGSLLDTRETIDGAPALEWVQKVLEELATFADVTLLPSSTVFGYHDHNFLTIAERCGEHVRQRQWRVRARQVVLAQGAIERPLVFCNNDRPGVMLASAVSSYINRYAVLPGERAVVFTNNDSAYQTALDLKEAGARVQAVVDSRSRGAGDLGEQVKAAGIPVLQGHLVTDVDGKSRVTAVSIAKWDGVADATIENSIHIECDLLAMSGGFSPAVHLHSHSGAKNRWDDKLSCFVPGEAVQPSIAVGSGNGTWSLAGCLREGADAGLEAAVRCGMAPVAMDPPEVRELAVNPLKPLWRVPATRDPDRCPKQFVDFQNDTSAADIRLAVREGYRNVEHVKRYTALGFGTDQGKLGNINGMAILAETLGESIPSVGTTTFRPPYTPVTFGTVAGESIGDLYDPVRKTAMHEWHEAAGAKFENVGQWHRPWYFPQRGEKLHEAVARECLATRRSLGILDASTLGKIDVRGPDAVEFLERIYTHDVGKMEVGRSAYGIMLGEDGMVKDDGVMARLGENRFYVTTTTGGAAAVLGWLESWLQTEWPELEVYLTSLTDQYSTISLAGPNSRRLLEKVGATRASAPTIFRSCPSATPRSPDCRCRSSASASRVNWPSRSTSTAATRSDCGKPSWRADRSSTLHLTGTETMHVLRAEKGFVIVGQDTDGSVTPVDLRMNWMLSKTKDYLGRRSLARPDCLRRDRKQFVGLLSEDGKTVIPEGAQLVDDPNVARPVPMCGHVSSSYMSACLGHPIALALVAGGHSRKGEVIHATLADGSFVPVRITSPVFYDPKNERQHD